MKHDDIIEAEFPGNDFDALSISSALTEVIAEVIAREPMEVVVDGETYEHEDIEYWLEEGGKVLAALIENGFIRRADFMWSESEGRAVHVESREAAGRRVRRRISDDRLRRVADAFRAGGIEAVKAAENVEERQAWRLKKAAKEKGYFDQEDERTVAGQVA